MSLITGIAITLAAVFVLGLMRLAYLCATAPIGFETDEHGWLPGTRADYPNLFSPGATGSRTETGGAAPQRGPATLSESSSHGEGVTE